VGLTVVDAGIIIGVLDAADAHHRAAVQVLSTVIGQGDQIWERFGHNGVRFRDTVTGRDVVYNWGLFDFGQKGFMLRLLRGTMRYAMGGTKTEPFLDYYVGRDSHVWEQELNLTNAQKVRALSLVRENEKPENAYYDYNYYLDNCSTRARDLIDLVLGGQLRTATESVSAQATFRSHTRRLLSRDKLPYFGVQLVLGHPADRKISRWEEMFLPVRMMQSLKDVSIRGVLQEGGCAGHATLRDEVLFLKTEHIHRHLAGNQFYIRLDTDGAQFRERRNVLVFERLLHQARGQRANPAQKARSTNSSQGPDTIEIFGWFRDQGR